MRLIADTHALLWWLLDDPRLSPSARAVIGDGATHILVSAAVAMEIGVKAARGRLLLPLPAEELVLAAIAAEGFEPLAIEVAHALHAAALPAIHRDPFDRLLVAQSQLEGLPILTVDPVIARYEVETIW